MSKKRVVRQEYTATSEKQAKTVVNPDSFYNHYPIWSFSKCDFDHDRWSMPCHQECLSDLMKRLKAFEGQQWKEILSDTSGRRNNTKNHSIPISDLIKEAQSRLAEINLDDFDKLYSLTITGERRLWGVITEGTFYIIWFDTDHEICPSNKIHS